MKKIVLFIAVLFIAVLFAGCSHNTSSFMVGTRANLGLDPQNATANISYMDGLNVLDVSRENSSWTVEVDAENGIGIDDKTGAVKGLKKVTRQLGPQITGYLVDLAQKDPEMARNYVEAVKNYWEYMKTQKENK